MTTSAPPLPLVTVVCPVFNEEGTVPLFYAEFLKAITEIERRVRFELLFVNNRSTDGTLDVLRDLAAKDPRVGYITLSRNYGYQASITAGMRHARGDAIANIDVDCEDPPAMLPRFIERWLDKVDVVYGIRRTRPEPLPWRLGRKLFYRFARVVSDHEIVLDMAEFFLVDRRVRDVVLSTQSTFPFVRGQVGYVGFKREGIPYARHKRVAGKTHYNFFSAARFGVAGILSSSTMPLRVMAYVGCVILPFDLLSALAVLFFGGHWGLDLAARLLYATVTIHLGCLVLAMGFLGIYLARVYKDVIGLPLYVVDERLSGMPRLEP
jgi:glycosyltransferase involved in cell wall biosynthesis